MSTIIFVCSLLQADSFPECSEPNPAVWALRPDYEKLRNGHVSVIVVVVVVVFVGVRSNLTIM